MWHLVTVNTYGTWLPGDPRGFQTRRHRQHVPPPPRYASGEETYGPALYENLHRDAKARMKGHEIKLTAGQSRTVVQSFRDHLAELRLACLVVSMDFWHGHSVLSCPPDVLERTVALLKGRASRQLGKQGLPGRVWARGYHARRLKDRTAVYSAVHYVRRHVSRGAVVWVNANIDALVAVEHPPGDQSTLSHP